MKLFQIEEPDGSPSDPDMPGAAVGIDASGECALVALSVGGNAALLRDREGFEQELPVPGGDAGEGPWQALFEGARLRAERALARPVTHAVVAMPAAPDRVLAARLRQAALLAGLDLIDIVAADRLDPAATPAEAAASRAEDLAPRPEAF